MHPLATAVFGMLLSTATVYAANVPAELPAPKSSEDLAVIGSEHITLDALPKSAKDQLLELQGHYREQLQLVFLEFERAQQSVIETAAVGLEEDRLLHKEAEAQHSSVEKLTKEHLSVPQPTEAQVNAFYEQHSSAINQPLAQVASAIGVRLERDAAEHAHHEYFDMLARKYGGRLTLPPLRQSIEPTGPERGAVGAPVTIVEFADFQCPFCLQMEPVLKEVLARYAHNVRLVYRYFPLTNLHPDALHAAEAGFCAAAQGKFWEMHDAMFADQSALSSGALAQTAQSLKLDSAAFSACMGSEKTLAAIKADYQAAVSAGVTGTPGLFVNGRYLSGAVSYDRLSDIIEDELQRTHATSPARFSSVEAPARSSNARAHGFDAAVVARGDDGR